MYTHSGYCNLSEVRIDLHQTGKKVDVMTGFIRTLVRHVKGCIVEVDCRANEGGGADPARPPTKSAPAIATKMRQCFPCARF